jgi:uncharacterized caspase-like protein
MYQEVIAIVIKSETDPDVRKTALGQAATLAGAQPGVVQAVADAAKDATRPPEERDIATQAVQTLGALAIAPTGTFVLSSSSGHEVSLESVDLQGGVFTHYLVNGLDGAARRPGNGSLRLSELWMFVSRSVTQFTGGQQHPTFFVEKAAGDPVIAGPGREFGKIVVIAIGNSDYQAPSLRLLYGSADAERVAKVFRNQDANVHLVKNAQRDASLSALHSAIGEVDTASLLIFYFSGHAAVSDGRFWLLPVDVDPERVNVTAISADELRDILRSAHAGSTIILLDTAFAGLIADAAR